MRAFRKINPIETSENLMRRSSDRNRLHHETRQHTLPYVIRNPRREPSQQSEFPSNQSVSRYYDNNSNHQRLADGRSSYRDYSSRNFSSPLNRNHFTTFRPNNRAEARSERTNISSNHSVMPAPVRDQKTTARHGDRYWKYPTGSRNSRSSTHGNTNMISNTSRNVNWVPPSSSQAGNVIRIASSSMPVENVNWIAPSTQSRNVNWIEPSSTQSGSANWITPSSFSPRAEGGNWTASSSTQFGNWFCSSTSSQLGNIYWTLPTISESSAESASQAGSEHLRNENHDDQQNEDTVHWIEDRNPAIEITQPLGRKSEKTVEPSSETISTTIECPVCLCNFEEIRDSGKHFVSGKCGHIICNMCINILLDQRKNCPRCRCPLFRRDIWRLYI